MEQSHEPLEHTSGESSRPPLEVAEKSWIQKVKEKFLPGVRITLLIGLIFYIAMFIVGIWGIHRCPINGQIPFFLIVVGGVGLLSKTITIVRETILKEHQVQYVESSLYTVELVFLLLGSYWVFKAYKPSFDERIGCNKTVYMFSFIFLAVVYAVLVTIGICYCCFLGCIYFEVIRTRTETSNDEESATRPIRNPDAESYSQSV